MAVLRQSYQSDNVISYVGTLGVFLAISCTVVMLRFKGFKAVLNLSGKQRESGVVETITATSVSIRGAYRANTDEFFEYGTLSQSPNSRIIATMVKLPPSQTQLRPTKSVDDITQPKPDVAPSTTPQITIQAQSTSSIQINKQNTEKNKNQKKYKRKAEKVEKEKIAAQKKRDKVAASEQAKQEKLRREREKKQAKDAKKRDKDIPQVPQAPIPTPRNNPLAQTNSSNAVESSAGPPPYDEVRKQITKNNNDRTGNTSFGKPVETDSWDLVSKHRQQMVRPTTHIGGSKPKQQVLDLQFEKMGPVTSRRRSSGSEADA